VIVAVRPTQPRTITTAHYTGELYDIEEIEEMEDRLILARCAATQQQTNQQQTPGVLYDTALFRLTGFLCTHTQLYTGHVCR
jgi:hypothetical protein